jgi:hydrogenase expression/formation protein HypC
LEVRDDQTALADLGGTRIEICTVFTPEVRPGDYVLVHAGFALQVLPASEAERLTELLEGERGA